MISKSNLNKILRNNSNFRLKKIVIGDTIVFVDQHSSLSGYFEAISEISYENKIIIIASLNFTGENYINNIEKISKALMKFDYIYIHIKIEKIF